MMMMMRHCWLWWCGDIDDDDVVVDYDDTVVDVDDDALADGAIACLRLHSNPIFPGVHKMFACDDDDDYDDDDYDDDDYDDDNDYDDVIMVTAAKMMDNSNDSMIIAKIFDSNDLYPL